MKLIGSVTSPYVRKVRVVMAEKKLDYSFELENVWTAETKIHQFNPLGKVPCLVMEDGSAMYDSRVIAEYLDTLTPVCKLLPPNGRDRADVKVWEALADGVLDAAVLVRLEKTLRPHEQQSAAWIERQTGKVKAGLQRDQIEETGRVVVERGPKGHRFVILPGQAYDYIDRDQALAALGKVAPGALYFGTLAQRGERSAAALAALLGATPATRFLDLNLRDGQVGRDCVTRSLQAAHIAKVNEEELQALFEWYFQIAPSDPPLSSEEVRASCRALLQMFSLDALIVTLGHRGSVYFGADGATIVNRDNPAPPFVIDTVGAGDAFSAIFLLGRARGWALEATLARANEFAGALCAIAGAVPRDMGFYDQWVGRWRGA
jgi:fructokinase